MMQTVEAVDYLKKMLAEGEFDSDKPDPRIAWDVFKVFVQEPVDCADDGILVECGVFNFSGEALFYLEFVRQFSFEVGGEYDHMEQLHCTFTRAPTDQLRQTQKNLWAYNFPSLEAYFKAVELLPEFQIALSQDGWMFNIAQWEV